MYMDDNQFLDLNDKDNLENNDPILFDNDDEEQPAQTKKQIEELKQVEEHSKIRPQTSHQPNNYNFLYDKDDFDDINTDAYKHSQQQYQNQFYSTVQQGQNNAFQFQSQSTVAGDLSVSQTANQLRPTTATSVRNQKYKEQLAAIKQKQLLKNQISSLICVKYKIIKGKVSTNQFKKNSQFSPLHEVDEDKVLQNLIKQNNQLQYEPGTQEQSNLPKLQSQNAHIQLNQQKNETPRKQEKEQPLYQEEKKISKINISESSNSDSRQESVQSEDDKVDTQPAQNDKNLFHNKTNKLQKLADDNEDKSHSDAPQKLVIWDNMDIGNIRDFVTLPCPKGIQIQTTVKRIKSGFGRFYPKYRVYLSSNKNSQEQKFLMAAKKRSWNKTSNYLITLSFDNFKKDSKDVLGKLRSNFLGTEFKIYDNGQNPKKCKFLDQIRQELGAIHYESNVLGAKGPRKMHVYLPSIKSTGEQTKYQPMQVFYFEKSDGILETFKNGRVDGIRFFFNKPPKWNEQVQAFVLNFAGRVDKPSVKNFQLIDEQDDDLIYMQFGRTGNDAFTMDIQWPFSILQAFTIALSSFDYKIACE